MSQFLRRILLFATPLLLICIGMECLLRSLPNSYRTKAAAVRMHADSIETIILGNSHAYYGIRPALLPEVAVNLGNVSQTLPLDREMLEHYAPLCPRLKRVYLICDHSNLFDPPLDSDDDSFRVTYYHLYMGLCRPAWSAPLDWELWDASSASEKLKQKLFSGMSAAGPDCDSLGWGCNYTLSQKALTRETPYDVRRRAERHTCSNYQFAEDNAEEALKIAAYCQAHQIQLIILATPVYASYLQHIPTRQKGFLKKLIQQVQQSYGASWLDFSTDVRFTADDFFNVDHLSDVGATHFTHLLLEERTEE